MPEHANASAVALPNSDGQSDTSTDVQFECTKGSCPNSSILDYAYENELERTENQYNAPKIMPLYRRSNSVSMPISLNSNEIAPRSLNQNNCKTYGSLDHNQFVSNLVLPCNVDDILADDSCPILTEDEKPPEDIEEKLHCGFTKRQLKVFISLVLLSLNDIMGYSAISPFFPVVAAEKGLTPFQVGMIFSSYSIAGIFFSFIIGLVLVRVGAKFCVIAGMFWNAGAIICFGFIGNVGPTPFLALSIISRALMGVGSSTAFTAMFAIVFQEFSERSITVLSLSEALVGVGGMLGPVVGGTLYTAGGYMLPFMVLGGIQVTLLIVCWYTLPYVPVEPQISSTSPMYLLRHSSALLSSAVIIVVFSINSFLIATVSEFLNNELGMNAIMISLVSLAGSVCYAGLSPLWGYIADRWKNSYLMEVGSFGLAVGMSLVGPATIFRHLFGWTRQREWLVFVSTMVNGLFFGATLMPTFNEMLMAAKELQIQESLLAQYGLVSGLWNMSFSIGDIIGPTLGGVLVEMFSFSDAAAMFSLVSLTMALLKLAQRYYRYRTRHKRQHFVDDDTSEDSRDERKPLLQQNPTIQ